MANNISLSASMRSNLLALQSTSLLQDMTQDRLATGKKVNSALDNPGSYFTAQSLNNRAADLSNRLDGIGQALQTLKETDKSLTSLTNLVEQAKALATQASEAVNAAGLLSSLEASDVADLSVAGAAGSTVGQTVASVFTQMTAATTLTIMVNGGVSRTIDVSVAGTVTDLVTELNTELNQDGVQAYWDDTSKRIEFAAKEGTTLQFDNVGATGDAASELFGSALVGSANKYTFSAPASSDYAIRAFNGLAAADSFNVTVYDSNGATVAVTGVTIGATDSIASVVAAINAVNSNITATFNTSTNRIEFKGTAGYQLQLDDGTGSAAQELVGGGKVGSTNKTTFGDATGNATVANKLEDFKVVMEQIDSLVADASYKGKNLLKGSDTLSVLFNEDGSSKMTVNGVNFTHDSGLEFTKSSTLSWDSMGKIEASINQAKAAIDTIRSQQAKFGTANSVISTREDFTKNMVDTLKGGADKLVLADMNEEAANMLALQTQRSLATNSLTMASQAAQSVLQLFR
ncbi:MAG TPA: flagellin [Candidatus Omnitrophota bacterium]|nr:flagellin [Candidatus Omnitrophota bacterium]